MSNTTLQTNPITTTTPAIFDGKKLREEAMTEALRILTKPANDNSVMEIERAKVLISLAATVGPQA